MAFRLIQDRLTVFIQRRDERPFLTAADLVNDLLGCSHEALILTAPLSSNLSSIWVYVPSHRFAGKVPWALPRGMHHLRSAFAGLS